MNIFKNIFTFPVLIVLISCSNSNKDVLEYTEISREKYSDQLYGFWLGQSIANWTGLITEMDKIDILEANTDENNFYFINN